MKPEPHPYEDILHVPRPTSYVRPPMSRQDRAAQFAPFAALTGHEAAIGETARVTQQRKYLTEDKREQLDRKQQILQRHAGEHPPITVCYFQADTKKSGGSYQTVTGHLRGVNYQRRLFRLTEGAEIPLDDIVELDSPLFSSIE